jgi:hypothetical protein
LEINNAKKPLEIKNLKDVAREWRIKLKSCVAISEIGVARKL